MGTSSSQMSGGSQFEPMRPAGTSGQVSQADLDLASQRTPGMVMFAATMLMLFGGFQLVWAIVEFFNAVWISSTTYGNFGGYLWLWAILDLALAFVAFYAGYTLLTGGRFGQVMGLIIAGVSAVRWFFYLPAAPLAGIVMLAIDAIIIYALITHNDYFMSKGEGLG